MIKAARRVVEKLQEHGHKTYFAGGWVRDYLLRRKNSDIDIATSARPEEVSALFPRSRAIGAHFGVMQVRSFRRSFEVATFRTDCPYIDGRHPTSVVYSNDRSDALRRDFTINGLFYDPLRDEIFDYVNGRRDLDHRVIRTIGDPRHRFGEDKLRLLRAVRFACTLGFRIDTETWEAMIRLAPGILQVSWERIRDEVVKILMGPDPGSGLRLLHESRLLVHILPEVEAMVGVEQPPEYHPEGDVFVHTAMAMGFLRQPGAVLAVGTLLHDVGKPATFERAASIRFHGHVEVGMTLADAICRRLRMSNDEREGVVELIRHHMRFMHVREMKRSTLARFLRLPHFADHLEMHRADCKASHGNLDSYTFCRRNWRQLQAEPARLPPLITGDDLIAMGYAPGPAFKTMIRSVEDLQLEGTIQSAEEAREHLIKAFPLPPGSRDKKGDSH
jgi:poly(A) polymerase